MLAGPGSGKSTVLIQRYMKMLSEGVPFDDMLNLTFTAAAAQELVARAGILNAKSVFRTFHSFALELLKNERDKLPFKTIDTILPFELQEYELMFSLCKVYPAINWRTLQEKITGWKCGAICPEQALEESQDRGVEYFYALAYREYEVRCRKEGWLDFSSLMQEAVKLLESNEEVRNRYKRRYLAVDEAQDCDSVNFRLLQLLFDGNIFAVGDENQLIFAWRNAQEGNLTNFAKVFPGAKVLFLGTNHRSVGNLVQFLKEIIPTDNGLASRMTTYNELGKDFTITKYADDEEEADEVIKKAKGSEDTAILARTNRQLFVFQRLCAIRGVKYNFLGKKDFWDQKEVKKLLDYAKGSNDYRPANVVLTDLIQRYNMIETYSKVGSSNPMEASPVENLNSIVKMSKGKGTTKEFLDYLRKLTHARKSSKALTLSTVHMAKGREWHTVYLAGACQGKMPHQDGDGPEEHRIMFVACSRASKELHISYYGNLSQYLTNYKDRVLDFELKQEVA